MKPDVILHFWFEEATPQQWFMKDERFDQTIRDRFGEVYKQAATGELDAWKSSPQSVLALVIILDQFPRNMFRGSPESFASDAQALEIAKNAISKGQDRELPKTQRRFLYMPFMHSENLADQNKGIELFQAMGEIESVDYAIKHRDIVARFGRFPHRNVLLGRATTKEEAEFLMQPGSSF